jgi:hypothetical protein
MVQEIFRTIIHLVQALVYPCDQGRSINRFFNITQAHVVLSASGGFAILLALIALLVDVFWWLKCGLRLKSTEHEPDDA